MSPCATRLSTTPKPRSRLPHHDPLSRRSRGLGHDEFLRHLPLVSDADHNATTGVTLPGTPRLEPQPVQHTAIVTLEKYGKAWQDKQVLLSIPASGPVKEPGKSRVTGSVVQAVLPYAAMGVKSGQTIRLILREACAGPMGGATGLFPEVVLTLK